MNKAKVIIDIDDDKLDWEEYLYEYDDELDLDDYLDEHDDDEMS